MKRGAPKTSCLGAGISFCSSGTSVNYGNMKDKQCLNNIWTVM